LTFKGIVQNELNKDEYDLDPIFWRLLII
jgi:hypothetical protein